MQTNGQGDDNMNNYLDKIQWETRIVVDFARLLGKESYTKKFHFLNYNLEKPIFHKNLSFLFSKYSYAHAWNTFLVDDTPYKSLFNGRFNAIYVKTFEKSRRYDNYLLGTVFPYMETFHFLELIVPTFVQDKPFGRNIDILGGTILHKKTLFECCTSSCDPSYCTNVRKK
jgi:hypothetical protein